jgi:hypothetical protein
VAHAVHPVRAVGGNTSAVTSAGRGALRVHGEVTPPGLGGVGGMNAAVVTCCGVGVRPYFARSHHIWHLMGCRAASNLIAQPALGAAPRART